jgi:beta-lactamase superfamily II metal-dependent hydrolase
VPASALPPDTLRVRVYDVRFGDAILISVPDRAPDGSEGLRHVLIDVGNVLSGDGGEDAVFGPVVRDVLAELGGRPLDLYVMTHEHMDHVQGLFYAASKLGLEIAVRRSWLTASSAEDYYDRFEQAKKKRRLALAAYEAASLHAAARREASGPLQALLLNNDSRSTGPCVDHLRRLAPGATEYVFRGFDVAGKHPFLEPGTSIEVWAPEEDTSIYYGAFRPVALGVAAGAEGVAVPLADPLPPPGVDAGAFYDLVEARRRGVGDNVFGIDAAANNSSVVFCLEWRGWRLLFAGDAEQRSWKEMHRQKLLKPVHFLKVGHHGSSNGTPPPDLLDILLPEDPPDSRPRSAAVSTCTGSYAGVPDGATLDLLRQRAALRSTEELADGEPFLDFFFPA